MTTTVSQFASLMKPEDYNKIPIFPEENPFDDDVIRKAGEVIRRHKMESKYGAILVHRHFEMPPDSIAIKDPAADDIEIMRLSRIDTIAPRQVYGCSFKLVESGEFQAYEHSTYPVETELPEAFRQDLTEFICQHHLQDMLGLFCRDHLESGVELNLFQEKICVQIPFHDVPKDVLPQTTPATWVFSGPEAVTAKACVHRESKRTRYFRLIVEAALRKRGIAIPELTLSE